MALEACWDFSCPTRLSMHVRVAVPDDKVLAAVAALDDGYHKGLPRVANGVGEVIILIRDVVGRRRSAKGQPYAVAGSPALG